MPVAYWLYDLAACMTIAWSLAFVLFLALIAHRGKFYIGVRDDDDES